MLKANYKDIEGIILVHMKAFKGFFLTELGPYFLKTYYRTLIDYDESILIFRCNEKNCITGFVSGFLNPEIFYQLLKSQRLKLIIASLPAIIKHPKLIKRILENMISLRSRGSTNLASSSKTIELSSIAVHPDYQVSGLGKSLLCDFETEAKRIGADQVYLHTDTHNNEKVNYFYRSNGYKLLQTFIAPGKRSMNIYSKNLY